MVGRAQAAAVTRKMEEEEEAGKEEREEREGDSSREEDEVFAAALKATATRLGKLKVDGEGGGGGGGQGKKGAKHSPLELAAAAAAAAAPSFDKEEIPKEYVCPISCGIMFAPVIAMDGHSYEQAAIEEWIKTRLRKGQPITSPFTNQPMARTLIPNLALRNLIRIYCEEQSLPAPTGPAVYNMG
jgi:hypothetical protein